MSKTSCITLPPNDFFTVTRNCFLQICQQDGKPDECAAKLLDMLVNFHDWRLAMGFFDPRKQILQNHTHEQLRNRLLGTFGITKIKQSIALLVKAGFLKIHSNPDPSKKSDRTHYYEIIPAKIQQKLNELETGSGSHQSETTDHQSETTNHYQDPYQDRKELNSARAHAQTKMSDPDEAEFSKPETDRPSLASSDRSTQTPASNSGISQSDKGSAARSIKFDKNNIKPQPIFGTNTLELQRQKASVNSWLRIGIANKRWQNLRQYQEFEEYARKWVKNRPEDLKKSDGGVKDIELYLSALIGRTARCDREESPDLLCWQAWISEPRHVQIARQQDIEPRKNSEIASSEYCLSALDRIRANRAERERQRQLLKYEKNKVLPDKDAEI